METSQKVALCLLAVIGIILVAGMVIETGMFAYAYVNADKVECDWFMCKFTQENHKVTINQTCYQNGKMINCTEIQNVMP